MHRQIGILLKKLASGVARSIQKGLCVTGLMLVLGVCWRLPKRDVTEAYHKDIWFGCGQECSIRIAKFFWLSLWHREQAGWRRRREFGATISMDYRELTTQSIILSFYTLRLPFTAQELRRDRSSIDMWKPEWVWGDRVKQLIATWSLRTLFHKVRHRDNLCLWAIFHERLQDN